MTTATVAKPGSATANAAAAPTTLAQALLEAQRQIEGVAKGSFNEFNRYKYASADAIVAAAREALNEAGVVVTRTFTVSATDITDDRVDKGSGETIQNPVYRIDSTFKIEACDEAREATMPWYAITDKGRPIDKAIAGALTVSLSYFLRDLLLIPREEENDSQDRRDDRSSVGTTARREPKGAPAKLLGPAGAGRVRRLVEGAGLKLDDLRTAIETANRSKPPFDPAGWPAEWEAKVVAWVEAKKRNDGTPVGADGTSMEQPDDDTPSPDDDQD